MNTVTAPVRTSARTDLRVDRSDLRFRNTSFDSVLIEIDVHNDGDARSAPATLRVDAAAFGAFVPWRPLAVLQVPAIAPRAAHRAGFEAGRTPVAALGSIASVPPARIAAVAAGAAPDEHDDAADPTAPRTPARDRVRDRLSVLLRRRPEPVVDPVGFLLGRLLPPDLLEVAGSANPHWVGNLNVFLGGKAVERHLARSLRVHAGRANLALFTLGDGADAYRFELAGDAADWSVSLSRAPRLLGRRHGAGDGALPTDTWHDFQGTSTVYLCLQPPAGAERGALEVHVQQRSTGRTAVVEFDLDPGAQGPGCYAL